MAHSFEKNMTGYLSDLSNMWIHTESNLKNSEKTRQNPNIEIIFFLEVAHGDVEAVERNIKENLWETGDIGMGMLSNNPLNNLKYRFVVSISIISRMCTEFGMQTEYAFRLSDFYIRQLDGISTEQGVIELFHHAILDFSKKMRLVHTNISHSKPVNEAINYIYKNIQTRITLKELAKHLNLSENYFSRLFKKEMGMSVSDYIRNQKVDRAMVLLRNSDLSIEEISDLLAFSSQSHFIQVFRSQTLMTPKVFRDEFYQTHFKIKSGDGQFHAAPPKSYDTDKNKEHSSEKAQ